MAGVTTEVRAVEGQPVAWITVDRPEKLNALNTALIAELTGAAEELMGDEKLRAVVLTGTGEKAFIGGADIGEMADLTPETAEKFILNLHGASATLRRLPVPVVARIQGYCFGGGMEVAAACDMRIASENAVFGMPEVALGLPSVIEAALFPRLIGDGRARWLLMTGQTIEAHQAYEWGFVEETVPAGNLDRAVEITVGAIVNAGPEAVRAQKALMRRWDGPALDEAIRSSVQDFVKAYETGEPQKMMKAFLDKRRGAEQKSPRQGQKR